MGKVSKYITKEALEKVISYMHLENALAMKIALSTGLRVTDVLNLRIGDIRENRRFRIVEHKTGKNKHVYIPAEIRSEVLKTRAAGQHDGFYVFPARVHWKTHHRTRQAVYKDMQRAIVLSGVNELCSPHSARKVYAVEKLKETKNIVQVQQLLNHKYKSTTMIYAFSDLL